MRLKLERLKKSTVFKNFLAVVVLGCFAASTCAGIVAVRRLINQFPTDDISKNLKIYEETLCKLAEDPGCILILGVLVGILLGFIAGRVSGYIRGYIRGKADG